MICPGVQKPHCTASVRTKASTSGCSRRPSIVVTSRSPTVCTSVMHASTGTPSSCTVHAPQWPSPQAPSVPVRPSWSRRASASVAPTGTSTSYMPPLMRSSSVTGHRQDVREVDEPKRRPADDALVGLVLELREHPPQLARSLQQLSDLLALLRVAVAVGAGVQREAEDADRVRLPRPKERR